MRRSRFTVYRVGVEPIVCLAYSAAGAREYYDSKPPYVTRVVKGDYRKKQSASARLAVGGFKVDTQALKDACELLQLELPVKLRYNGRHGNTAGNYRFNVTHHDIMLKRYLTPDRASKTLWHELCHAMQAERVGGTTETWASTLRIQGRYSYRNRPIEVEARAMSETMADCPLTTNL